MAIFEVTAAAAVVRHAAGSESYLYRGTRFDSEGVDEGNLERLEVLGFVREIDPEPEPDPEPGPEPADEPEPEKPARKSSK